MRTEYDRAYYAKNIERRRFQARMYSAMTRNHHRTPTGWALWTIGQVLRELQYAEGDPERENGRRAAAKLLRLTPDYHPRPRVRMFIHTWFGMWAV